MQGVAKQTAIVVHRYPLWRDALQDTLLGLGFDVLKATESVDEALALVGDSQPDLLVAGMSPARRGAADGVEIVRRARSAAPGMRAVVLAESYVEAEAEAALRAGAYAYILEATHADDIRAAIRQGFQPSVFMRGGETPRAHEA
jgi:DNA-binding NarL/FixJ family response regulator